MSDNWIFDAPPEAGRGEGKTRFGSLGIIASRVNLVTGDPGYTVPGLNAKGEPFHFAGKQLDPNGKSSHIILTLDQANKDGQQYTAFQHFMYWESDPDCKITFPTLKAHFGEKLEKLKGTKVNVQVDEVTYTEKNFTHYAWKVVKVFDSLQARDAAEADFFKRSANGSGNSSPVSAPSAASSGVSSGNELAPYQSALVKNVAKWRAEGNGEDALKALIVENFQVTPKSAQEWLAAHPA